MTPLVRSVSVLAVFVELDELAHSGNLQEHTNEDYRGMDVTSASDDDQPTAAVGDGDATGVVAESPRTVAAEQHSEPPTTIVPDVGPTQAAELAWSSEAQTDEIADRSRGWHGRILWVPLVALLCASVAVVVWFSVTLYRQHEHPVTASPSVPAPATPPPSASARPAPPPIPPSLPTSPPTAPTTTTSAQASGPVIGEPCSDWSKIARDSNTGLTIICDGATGAGAPAPHWTTDDFSHVIGVQTIGTSCAGSQPYAMAISPDDYLVACFPSDGSDRLAGQGSTWPIYHP